MVHPDHSITYKSPKNACVAFGAARVNCTRAVYAKQHTNPLRPGFVAIWVLASGEIDTDEPSPVCAFDNVPDYMAFEFTNLLRYLTEGRITRETYEKELSEWKLKLVDK
jgi:hypothetical protein